VINAIKQAEIAKSMMVEIPEPGAICADAMDVRRCFFKATSFQYVFMGFVALFQCGANVYRH